MELDLFQNRHNPEAFEPVPAEEPLKNNASDLLHQLQEPAVYRVRVNNQTFDVEVNPKVRPILTTLQAESTPVAPVTQAQTVTAPLAGQVFKLNVRVGDAVQAGDVVVILEAMKMETEVRTEISG